MKKAKMERKDGEMLKDIWDKITVDGTLREPLTLEEQVLIFAVANWIKENVEE